MASPIQRYTEAEATPAKLAHRRLYAQCTGQSDYRSLQVDQYGNLQTTATVTINGSDIQIGAVELKDHDSEQRVDIGPAGDAVGNGLQALAFRDAGGLARRALVDAADHQQVDVLSSALPSGAATEITAAAIESTANDIQTAVEKMDDWDESDRAKVNPIVGQAGVAANAGAADALTQRTITATDSPDAVSLATIDDWDQNDRAKTSPIPGQDGIAAHTGIADALTTRVVAASDSPEVTALEIMDDWDESNRAKVNPIVGQAGVAAGAGAVDALTQRTVTATDSPDVVSLALLDNIVETVGDAAPADAAQVGGKYQVVPTAHADGDLIQLLMDAYGKLVNPSYNPATGSDIITDGSPASLAKQPLTVRASAALAAAGAFDTPTEIPTGGMASAAILVPYTRGLVGGAFKMKVELGYTINGTDYWPYLASMEPGVQVDGNDVYDGIQRRLFKSYATSASAETLVFAFNLRGASKIRVSFAEYGVVGTPGTLAAYGMGFNFPVQEPVARDSKAYTSGTDSIRTENISPETYMAVQGFNTDTTNIAATTYIPSSAGSVSLGYNFLTITGKFIDADGTLTGYLEVTNDEDTSGGDWVKIYGVNAMTNLPVNQVSVTNGTLTFALFFDTSRWKNWRFVVTQTGATNTVIVKGYQTAL